MSKILRVDDSPTETHQFKTMLELIGHEVITAEKGRNGMKMTIAEQPDITLMDIVLMDIAPPDMNGFQATRQIVRGADTKHIPVIIVSSKNQETDKVRGQCHGTKRHSTKRYGTKCHSTKRHIMKPVDTNKRVSAMQACL